MLLDLLNLLLSSLLVPLLERVRHGLVQSLHPLLILDLIVLVDVRLEAALLLELVFRLLEELLRLACRRQLALLQIVRHRRRIQLGLHVVVRVRSLLLLLL